MYGISRGLDAYCRNALTKEWSMWAKADWRLGEEGSASLDVLESLQYANHCSPLEGWVVEHSLLLIGGANSASEQCNSLADRFHQDALISVEKILEWRAFVGGWEISESRVRQEVTWDPGLTPVGQSLIGGENADSLVGADGNDSIDGAGGNDTLRGGAGDDGIKGRAGDDLIYGGDGDDRLPGEGGDDRIYGEGGNDRLGGGDGNDLMVGGTGNDRGGGGNGNDTLRGEDGNDLFSGGAGNDLVEGGNGDDRLAGSYGHDTVEGGAGNDTMGGGTGRDIMGGQDGDDVIGAGDHDDRVWGGTGNDFLGGGDGNDILRGNEDNDTLNGGYGDDTLYGGQGADTFVFNATSGGGTSIIADFEDGTDVIRVIGLRNPADPVARLDITNITHEGQQAVSMDYGKHTIIVLGARESDFSEDDFLFV